MIIFCVTTVISVFSHDGQLDIPVFRIDGLMIANPSPDSFLVPMIQFAGPVFRNIPESGFPAPETRGFMGRIGQCSISLQNPGKGAWTFRGFRSTFLQPPSLWPSGPSGRLGAKPGCQPGNTYDESQEVGAPR
jgi:hypothetical protein